MDDFVAEGWRTTLRDAGLDSFDALWSLEADWYEPPNRRRGGWSGVVRLPLSDGPGGTRVLFVKRQENHMRRSFRHPVHGEPTFAAEMRNIRALHRVNVPTLTPVYYAERRVDGHWRAILATEELAPYRPLDAWIADWCERGWPRCRAQRRAVIAAAADTIHRLHRHGLVHRALHAKHLFVRLEPDGRADVRLIDLEKMRRVRCRGIAARRDLDALNRRTPAFSRTERLLFLMHYHGVHNLAPAVRRDWRWLDRRFRDRHGRPGDGC